MGLGYSLLVDLLGTLMFFYVPIIYFLEPRRGNRYANLCVILTLFMVWELFFRYIYILPITLLYTVGSYVVIFLLYCLLCKGTWVRKFLCTLWIIGISLLAELTTIFLFYFLFPNILNWYIFASIENETLTNAARIMGNLTSELFNMIYALVFLCIVQRKNWKMFWSLMLIPVYQFFLILGYFMMCDEFSIRVAWIGIALVIFNLVLNLVIIYLIEGIFKKLDMQEKMLDISRRQQEEYEFYQSESQSVEQMRLIRHDFMNQLQTAYSMMDEPENADKVKDMIGQMKERLEER